MTDDMKTWAMNQAIQAAQEQFGGSKREPPKLTRRRYLMLRALEAGASVL
jgi:hypothetical protein